MSTYEIARHFADSWGLVAMAVLFTVFVGWTYRKGAHRHHDTAATMIFREESNGQDD